MNCGCVHRCQPISDLTWTTSASMSPKESPPTVCQRFIQFPRISGIVPSEYKSWMLSVDCRPIRGHFWAPQPPASSEVIPVVSMKKCISFPDLWVMGCGGLHLSALFGTIIAWVILYNLSLWSSEVFPECKHLHSSKINSKQLQGNNYSNNSLIH